MASMMRRDVLQQALIALDLLAGTVTALALMWRPTQALAIA